MQRPFAVDPVLTGIAVGYRNPAQTLIADDVMPRVPVAGEKFKWTEYPIAESFTLPETRVGRTSRVNRVSFSGQERTSSINDYGLEDAIPYSDIKEAERMRHQRLGNYDPVYRSTEGITDLLLLDREVRVAERVQNPSNYAAARRVVLSGSSRFSDYELSDPIGTLKAGFNGTLIYRPNTLVTSREVWSVLSSHPHIVNAIKGNVTGRGIVSRDEFLHMFAGEGLNKIAIGEGFVNTARKGQAAALDRVWGNSLALLYIDPNVRFAQGGITWGFTAQYGTRIAGSWIDRDIGLEGGTIVRAGERVQEEVMAKDVGYLIQNVIER